MKTTVASAKVLHASALILYLTTTASSSLATTGFPGNLKGVTITDSQEINKPPVASFTYSKNGDIVTFNASSSSDPDGNIVNYSWDFGDGSKGNGITTDHQFSNDISEYNITLSLLDNSGGVSILQKKYNYEIVKLRWTATSDQAEIPQGKMLVKNGSGLYIDNNCYNGHCYDNFSDLNNIKIPIENNDVINKDEFELNLYFNPKILANYDYIFGFGVDQGNAHLVHMYEDGSLYCRTVLSGSKYYKYILGAGELKTGYWYKLKYVYSKSNKSIKVYINDILKCELNNVDVGMTGNPLSIYMASDQYGKQGANILIDEVTIK